MIFVYFLACCLFIFLEGVFSASEIAFISSNALKLRHRMQLGDRRAKLAFSLISNPEKFLATTLVGTNISVIVSSSLATLILIENGISNSNLWITFFFTPIIVIFAELIPKNIGRYYREKFSCAFAPLIKMFEVILGFIVSGIEIFSRTVVRMFVKEKRYHSLFVTRREIKSILKEIGDEGVLDKGEKEAIEDIFDFRQTKVKDVITPLKEVVGIDYTDSFSVVIKKVKEYKFTRYPVFRNREVVGYINIFDLFYNNSQDWIKFIRPITHVGESQKLYDVFTNLRSRRENIALVMRGKKVLGIVTLEDIIREIITSIIKY